MRLSNETTNFVDQFCPQESSVAIQVMRMLFCAIVILIALIGNAHIITVVCQDRRLRRAAMNLLVVNMSMSDIIITVFNSPRLISRALLGTDWAIRGEFGYILCKAFPFTKELSSFVLVLTLLLIAVDRLIAVLFPLKRFITNSVAYAAIFFEWIVAIALRSPILNGQRFILGEDGQTYCFLQFDSELAFYFYVKYAFATFYSILLTCILILFGVVMVLLKKRKLVGDVSTSRQQRYKDRTRRTRKVMRMLVTIMFVLALGWSLHFFLPLLLLRFGPKVCNLALPALFLNQSTSAINPCIYVLYIKNYRCSFREIWRSLYRRCMKMLSSNNKIKPQDISTVCRRTVEGQQK